ncbi:MAG: DUF302 domain-containing protein [Polyangiaceae bacterium]
MSVGIQRKLNIGFEEALKRLPKALEGEGFGVLTEIDVAATLHKKLGVEHRPYRILGACNPTLAHRALGHDLSIGTMLPCNVVVYQGDDGNAVLIAVDPLETLAARDEALRPIAEEVRGRLVRVVNAV